MLRQMQLVTASWEGELLGSLQSPTLNAPSPARLAVTAAGRFNPSTL